MQWSVTSLEFIFPQLTRDSCNFLALPQLKLTYNQTVEQFPGSVIGLQVVHSLIILSNVLVINPMEFSSFSHSITVTSDIVDQWFSLGVWQELFKKHSIPGYLVRGNDLFPFRLSNKKMTANTVIVIRYELIKIIPIFFLVRSAKNTFFACCRISVIKLYVPWDEKGCK